MGFQIQVREAESREKIFFHMPSFEDHRVSGVRAKMLVQGLDEGVQEKRRAGNGEGREVGETVNVARDPTDGGLVFGCQLIESQRRVEMTHAGMLPRPIAKPEFATNKSVLLKMKAFQVDTKTRLVHD